MKKKAFNIANETDYDFWWYNGRRSLFLNFLKKYTFSNSKIVDLGCSAGINLKMLKKNGYKKFIGVDNNLTAISLCKKEGFTNVKRADLCNLPFKNSSIDFVLATDVIEHIKDDFKAVSEIKRILASGNRAIITVPAFNFLWSRDDDIAQHKRRYTKKVLLNLLQKNGFKIEEIFYFNYILFIPIIITRIILKILRVRYRIGNDVNSNFVNSILKKIFTFDVFSSRIIKPFFGVSICALVKK